MSYNYMILEDKLEGDYKDAFKRADMYSLLVRIDEETREDMMMNLLDLLLSAQEEGKPAEKIVGKNLKTFCKNYFGHDLRKRQFRDFLDGMYRMAWFSLIIELIDMFTSDGPSGSNPLLQTTDITGYVVAICAILLFDALFVYICKPLLFQKKRLPFVAFCLISLAGSLLFVLGLLHLAGDNTITAPYWTALLVIVSYIVLYYILRAVSRYRDHGNIGKRRDPGEESFLKAIETSAANELPAELEKRFQKINRKREKKGKPLMSGEEYLQKMRSDVNRDKKMNPIVDAMLVVFVLFCVIRPFFTTTGGLLEPVISAACILLCEIPVFFLCRSINRGCKQREEIVDYCEQHGITLTQYVAELSQETSETDESELPSSDKSAMEQTQKVSNAEDEGKPTSFTDSSPEQSQETSEEDADA
ncbi:MAG: hypothetical protein J1E62_08875 [Lachnospiraceae bacterium]|nr:hypothetical protein [Lachnospiraceae bacterium]